jgi:hypothetical protein
MSTIQSARRTLSAWSTTQRRALSMAVSATRTERSRSDVDHVEVVLLAVLAATAPTSWRPGALGRATGLTDRQVADALADAEDAGLIEPGSSRTGRVGIVVPSVLAALGVGGYGLALEDVRADVRPSGVGVELSDVDLSAAFA